MSLAGLIFATLSGGALASMDVFEARAAKDIASRLGGKNKKVTVKAETHLDWASLYRATITASDFTLEGLPFYSEPQFGSGGRLDLLRLDLRNFTLAGLEVESLTAEIPKCRFDVSRALRKGELRLHSTGVGSGSVRITEAALAKWIQKKFREVKSCTVKVDRDVVWVEGYGEFLFIKTDFAVIAKLQAVEGVKLALADAKVYFNWRRADPTAAQAILKTLNPVVDLSKDLRLEDAVYVEKIVLRGGAVTASGKTKIPKRPADN
jgi:hypothetical protein